MTDNEIRICIAEACGWTQCEHCPENIDGPEVCQGKLNGKWNELPDYPNDLNAMHEAEKTISELRHEAYYIHLSATTRENLGHYGFPLITATARQRAEAFLRTIGKWRD